MQCKSSNLYWHYFVVSALKIVDIVFGIYVQSFPDANSNSQSLLANWSYEQPHSDPGSDSDSCNNLIDSDESDITAPSYSIITDTNDLSYQQLSESDVENISNTDHSDSENLDLNSSLQAVRFLP